MAAPATPAIAKEFNVDSQEEGTLLISIWELGEVVGPLALAPLSEVYGRLPVYHGATIFFVLLSLVASASANISMLIALRFLLGVSVASSTLNSCMVADMFETKQRGRALSIMGLIPYTAPCLGPTIGGFVSDYLGWRWTFRIVGFVTLGLEVALLVLLRETYHPVILERKAKRLRTTTGNPRLHTPYSTKEGRAVLLLRSLATPFRLFFTSRAIPLVAVSGSLSMGYAYVLITSLTPIVEQTYSFSAAQAGLAYLGLGGGMILGILFSGAWIDRRCAPSAPERRIALPLVLGYVLVMLGLCAYGWTARPELTFVAPVLCAVPVGAGFTAVTLASWAYLVDVFGQHAASATAAAVVVRNAASTALPLAAAPLAQRLGYGPAYSVLMAVGMAGALAPAALVACGARWRARSEEAGDEGEALEGSY